MNATFLCLALSSLLCLVCSDEVGPVKHDQCTFHKHTEDHSVMTRLDRLSGQRFSASDDKEDGFTYTIGICAPPDKELADSGTFGPSGTIPYKDAAVIQTQKDGTNKDSPNVLGRLSKTDIIGGTNWISLEYEEGDNYNHHCNKTGKRSVIMILCAPGVTEGKPRLIEENNAKTTDCYYLFEIDHQAACPDVPSSGLSVGSILIIIFLTLVGLYMLGGFIYQRFVVGAKGMEQIPNYAFWQDFGNLTSDGCNLVCRSGGGSTQPRQYRGIGDDQLQTVPEEEDDRDDHLLPM